MPKLNVAIVTRDSPAHHFLDPASGYKIDLLLSVGSVAGATPVKFDIGVKDADPALLAAAVAMLAVGRLEIDTLWVPTLPKPEMEKVFEKVVNYFAGKSKTPHTVTTRFYALQNDNPPKPADSYDHPIVLMGGGTDSCGIYAYFAKKGLKPVGLYYEYGQAAKAYERQAIFDLAQHFQSNAVRIPINLSSVRKAFNKFENISMEGAFPARNWLFYLTTLACIHHLQGNEIAVSVFKGEFDDNHPDHSPITLNDFQTLIDLYIGQGKCKVTVPMRSLDKSDAVLWYKEKIEPEWPIDKTRSCYGMFRRIDGACTGCMNKFVSMAFAGYDMWQTQFNNTRVKATSATKYFHKYFKRALEGNNYDDSRNSEIMWVMDKYPPSHKNVQAELTELKAINHARIGELLARANNYLQVRNAQSIEISMDDARAMNLV